MKKENGSNSDDHLKIDSLVITILIPIFSLIIGVLFSILIESSVQELVTITLLTMIFSSLLEYNINSKLSTKKIFENNMILNAKIDQLKLLSVIQDDIIKLKHPYFKKWSEIKLEEFIASNYDFFQGSNRTHPHAEDTFGIEGINHTQRTLRCLSSVKDYWDDNFAIEYLKAQIALIKTKGIRIQRIWVIDKENFEKLFPKMENQLKSGIELYYIFRNTEYMNPDWLNEDYLIQDDNLLVEINCESHKHTNGNDKTEHITINQWEVHSKIQRFMRILERAEKFLGSELNIQNNEVYEITKEGNSISV